MAPISDQTSIRRSKCVYLFLTIAHALANADYVDCVDGVLMFPCSREDISKMTSTSLSFAYFREFDFYCPPDRYVVHMKVADLVEFFLLRITKPLCHVTIQKKKKKG